MSTGELVEDMLYALVECGAGFAMDLVKTAEVIGIEFLEFPHSGVHDFHLCIVDVLGLAYVDLVSASMCAVDQIDNDERHGHERCQLDRCGADVLALRAGHAPRDAGGVCPVDFVCRPHL